ncbi:glycosyltransferase [Cognatishimia sp. WU-CL00825]|uniref:glycosyltransferase n=1 Tax=Cognatishimia sp. WU-CL00825 TaxID=3127658 RepID=UPI003365A1FD
MLASAHLAKNAQHKLISVPKNKFSVPRLNADIIVSHLSVNWRSLPRLIALRALHPQAKLIHVEHSYTQKFAALNVGNRRRFFGLLGTAYALFDHVVAVSHAQAGWLSRRGLVAPQKLCVIHPAVDLSRFRALSAPVARPKVFGAIGRLHPQKGFDVLIQAFARCADPDLRLKIFGDGPQREELEVLARKDPRVSLEGYRPNAALAMAEVEAVVVPSRWEAYGLVVQEALAARRPTLVANVDGLRDQIADGAILVKGQSLRDWALAIQTARSAPAKRQTGFAKYQAHDGPTQFERDWQQLLNTCLPAGAQVDAWKSWRSREDSNPQPSA